MWMLLACVLVSVIVFFAAVRLTRTIEGPVSRGVVIFSASLLAIFVLLDSFFGEDAVERAFNWFWFFSGFALYVVGLLAWAQFSPSCRARREEMDRLTR